MGTSPTQYINSPVAGTQYKSALWCGAVGATGDNALNAVLHAWSGANGGGSLVTVTGFEVWILDASNGDAILGHFNGGGSSFNTVNCVLTSSPLGSGQNGHYLHVAAKYTGGGSPGSIAMWLVFGASNFFWPGTPSFSPAQGGPGTTVTITGVRFTDATSVDYNGTNDGTFVVNSDISITSHVPSGATVGPIHVVNPVGSVASSSNFQPGQIFFGPTATNTPVAVWTGTSPARIPGVWVSDGAGGSKRIW